MINSNTCLQDRQVQNSQTLDNTEHQNVGTHASEIRKRKSGQCQNMMSIK